VQRAAAIIGSAIFLVIAPGTLAAYVPWYLTHWHFAPPLFPMARVLGAALIVAGLPILLDSFARFALQGLGTPAPVMPPKRLVVTGFFRYVRNPIYVAVTALIAGQGLLFGSVTVLEYGAIVWAGFFVFVVAYEEPALEREAMVTAHHPMARVGAALAPGAESGRPRTCPAGACVPACRASPSALKRAKARAISISSQPSRDTLVLTST
jgi:protein-S-isoprenylcysteine O-methyltransferase Ste14